MSRLFSVSGGDWRKTLTVCRMALSLSILLRRLPTIKHRRKVCSWRSPRIATQGHGCSRLNDQRNARFVNTTTALLPELYPNG